MPEWAGEVRRRLQSLRLTPSREAEIVDELSQHLEDRYQELCAEGKTDKMCKELWKLLRDIDKARHKALPADIPILDALQACAEGLLAGC